MLKRLKRDRLVNAWGKFVNVWDWLVNVENNYTSLLFENSTKKYYIC